jgi:hypothetical protein
MISTSRTPVFSPSQTLAALRELVSALDRRDLHADRESEPRIARDARLLRHQAVVRIEELRKAASGGERHDADLAAAIMTDDGGPPPET